MSYKIPEMCIKCDWLGGLKDNNWETYWCGHPDKNSCQMDLAERGECELVETTTEFEVEGISIPIY